MSTLLTTQPVITELDVGQPNDNEHKEEKQSSGQDDAGFKFLDNAPYNMVNPLVLAICISNYDSDKFDNLKGVKKDMETLKALWKDTFGFEMITNTINKTTNEYHVKEIKFWTKLDDARKKVNKRNDETDDSGDSGDSGDSDSDKNSNNKKDRYDGLIFVFAGHGYKDGIYTSDTKKIELKRIKKHFSSTKVPSLKDSPKIFIIDACRHPGKALPCTDDMLYKDPKFNETRGGNEQLPKFKFYHPFVNMLEIYGNTRGYSVLGSDEKGGSLVLVLSKYLSHAHNSKHSDMTLQQILNGMKCELHKKTNGNQTIEIHDTLLYDIKFNRSDGMYVNQFFKCLNFCF